MNMIEVFERNIMESVLQKLQYALEKLKNDKQLKRKIRVLADVSTDLEKLTFILKDSLPAQDISREKWLNKKNELIIKRDELFVEIEKEGFEYDWIMTLLNHEKENLDKVINEAREEARRKYLGDENMMDIDIFDNRIELMGPYIKLAKDNYIEGK